MTDIKSVLKYDCDFAKRHALRSATIIQSLLDSLYECRTNEEAVGILKQRKSGLNSLDTGFFLEEGIINLYLHSFTKPEEK